MTSRTSVNAPYQPRPFNFIFEYNKAWQHMVATDSTLRDIEIIEVTKMFACGKPALGCKELHCENKDCTHSKNIWFTYSSRTCSRYGKKSTDNWIIQQVERMPHCPWMHMTFTFPDVLWPLFRTNRWLLDKLCQLAVDNLLYAAKQAGLELGFSAHYIPLVDG